MRKPSRKSEERIHKSPRWEAALHTLAMAGIYAGLMVPLAYAPVLRSAFVALKVFWLQAAVGLTFPAFFLLAWRRPEFRPPRTRIAQALLVQLGAVALSVAASSDPGKGFWGTLDRMDGLWSLLHFAAWTFMSMGLLRDWPAWRRVLRFEVAVALAAGCIAALQIPFPAILGVVADVRVSGLFGNPNFSSAYHLAILFLVGFLWSKDGRPSRGATTLYLAAGALSILAIVVAGSRGPMLGLACGMLVGVVALGVWGGHRKAVVISLVAFAALVAVFLVFALVVAPRPGLAAFWERHQNLAHLFILADNADRFGAWALTWEGIRSHPILGWGNANFEALYDRHYHPMQYDPGTTVDNGHNLVLHTLATTGVIGLAATVFVWGATFLAVIRATHKCGLERIPAAFLLGLLLAHGAQAMFNPESPGTRMLCGLVVAYVSTLGRPQPVPSPKWKPGIAMLATMESAALALVVWGTFLPALASRATMFAVASHRNNQPESSWRHIKRAATYPTPYEGERVAIELQLLLNLAEKRTLDRLPDFAKALAQVRQSAALYRACHRSMVLELAHARLLRAMGRATLNDSLQDEAERAFLALQHDYPRRQEIRFARAWFLAERGKIDEAEQLLRDTWADEPRMSISAYQLGKFLYTYRDRSREGLAYMAKGARIPFPYLGMSMEDWVNIAAACASLGDTTGLRAVPPLLHMMPPAKVAKPYLTIAGLLESAGLYADRDNVLRLGAKHIPTLAERAIPVLAGQATLQASTNALQQGRQ